MLPQTCVGAFEERVQASVVQVVQDSPLFNGSSGCFACSSASSCSELQSQGKLRLQEALGRCVGGHVNGVFVLHFDPGRQSQAVVGFCSTAASLGMVLSRLGVLTVRDREEGLLEPPL